MFAVLRPALPSFARIAPGLALALLVAGLGFALRQLPGFSAFSPLILAIVLGIALRNVVGPMPALKPGIAFAMRRLLRAGIVLLGLQLTLGQLAQVGVGGIAVIVATLAATFLFTLALGRALGVPGPLTQLVAAGSSICGASAVIAADAVVQAEDEDVAYAVACVTVFGTLSMLAFPALGAAMGLVPEAYGLWTGAAIHEVAQVVAAGYQHGELAGETATIAKLTRVAMLAPVVLIMAAFAARRLREKAGPGAPGVRPPVPWFVLGFVAMMLVASTGAVPLALSADVALLSQLLLAVALAAMGLDTDFIRLRARGLAPLALGAGAWIFISVVALALVLLTSAA